MSLCVSERKRETLLASRLLADRVLPLFAEDECLPQNFSPRTPTHILIEEVTMIFFFV